MNLTINPGAATDDASQIDSLVETIKTSMETLNEAINSTIPSGIETTWSDTVKNNWTNYYGADVPEAMEAMQQSAVNLRLAVQEALKFDQEQ